MHAWTLAKIMAGRSFSKVIASIKGNFQAGKVLRKRCQCSSSGVAANEACSWQLLQGSCLSGRPLPPSSHWHRPLGALAPCLLLARRAVHRTAYLHKAKELESNPFYSKYQEKLGKVQSPIIEKTEQKKTVEEKPATNPRPRPLPAAAYSYTAPPSLESVMHMSKIVEKSAEEIAKIWREYHATKDGISAVIPADTYIQLHTKATYCPLFLCPLLRKDGYEFVYSQFSGHRCFFTSLINYQTYGENAPVCLTLSHYTELQDSKGIVLMAGEVDASILTTLEAQFLANQLQLYYASSDQERYALVRQFNHEPEHFSYQKLVEQLQNSGINLQNITKQ